MTMTTTTRNPVAAAVLTVAVVLALAAAVMPMAAATRSGGGAGGHALAPTRTAASRSWTIVHVTDIHGWVAGHPHLPELNADFGDFASLIDHMRSNAEQSGVNFYLFDTGDLIEGTGISDATPLHGQYIFPIIQKVFNYDGLTIGNHDVSHNNVVSYMLQNFIPSWGGRYLTSNALLEDGLKPLGEPYQVIERNGYRLLCLGYIYNFTQNANMTHVTPVEISMHEDYFSQAMAVDDIDMVVVLAHIDPQSGIDLDSVYRTLRKHKPDTPLVLLSGHRHVMYFRQYDDRAFTLESGKYFQEIGLLTFELSEDGYFNDFHYSWVPCTRENFYSLANVDADNFLTPNGTAIKQMIFEAQQALHLNDTLGCAAQHYEAVGDNATSLYRLYINEIIPTMIFDNSSGAPKNYFMMDSSSLRSDLFAGVINRNDVFTINPFNDTFLYWQMSGYDLERLASDIYQNHRGFLSTFAHVDTSATYRLIVCNYDAQALMPILENLFSSTDWKNSLQKYPTDLHDTQALLDYFPKYWPCRHDCPCN